MVDDSAVCDDFTQTKLQVHFSLQNTNTQIDIFLCTHTYEYKFYWVLIHFFPTTQAGVAATKKKNMHSLMILCLCEIEPACDASHISAKTDNEVQPNPIQIKLVLGLVTSHISQWIIQRVQPWVSAYKNMSNIKTYYSLNLPKCVFIGQCSCFSLRSNYQLVISKNEFIAKCVFYTHAV